MVCRVLDPRRVYPSHQARINALGFDDGTGHYPTWPAVAHGSSGSNEEAHPPCAVVNAFLLTIACFTFRPGRASARFRLQTDIA